MIEFKGTHKCGKCGFEYPWIARMIKGGGIVTGRFEDIHSENVDYFGENNDSYIIVGLCPRCCHKSVTNLYEEISN